MSFVSSITPEQQYQYAQGQSNAAAQLGRSQAANQYNQGLATQDYQNRLFDFNTAQDRSRDSLPTNYIQRGVFNSGIYRNALRDYAINRMSGERNLMNQYQQQMAGMTLQGRNNDDSYSETMANLYGQQYAASAGIASVLKSIL